MILQKPRPRYSVPMLWGRIREWLAFGSMEHTEGFRQEILSAADRGAKVLAVVETGAGAVGFFGFLPFTASVALLVLAGFTLGISAWGRAYDYSRLLGWTSCTVAAALTLRSIPGGASVDYALGAVTGFMLAALAALPLPPLLCLVMGIVVNLAGIGSGQQLFLIMLALGATTMGAALYDERRSHYRVYLATMTSSLELRGFETRALRAESAGTMVRLTAALAHELSSPLGVLASGIDLLPALSARREQADPESRARLLAAEADLRLSLTASVERLRKTVNRIQQLTNLDEAETQEANLNDLVNDAVGIVRPKSPDSTRFELHLQPVPNVTCRPQRLLAVLCSVLSNSVEALGEAGHITVATAARDAVLQLDIQDDGRGIPAERLAHIFDPRFEVAQGRVSTGNWGLVTSRQYMKEHGGDIRILSVEGKGTTVCLTLPFTS
jgi:signal transduction histidine kinase